MAYPQTIRGEGLILETMQKVVSDEFFEAIEITWIKDVKVREKARQLLSSRPLSVGFGAQPPLLLNKLSLNSEQEEERKKAVAQVKECIDEAYFMGAQALALLSGPDPGVEKREKAKQSLVKSLKEMVQYARSKDDLPLILESFDRVPYGKNRLIGPTEEAVEIAQEIRKEYPGFGLLLDLSHLPLLKESSQEALGKAAAHLQHIHIGNCVMRDVKHPAYGDEHPPFGIEAGENGVNELREFLKVLLDIGYLDAEKRPIVSFEVKPFGKWTSEEVIRGAKETLRQAWGGL